MRHKVYGKQLGRNKDEREALFKNLVQSLFLHEKIHTTEAKAKAIKGLVDKLINQAKSSKGEKLVSDIASRYNQRNSGYTSLIRVGQRKGDGAMMVRMSLMEGDSKSSVVSRQSSGKPKSDNRKRAKK